MSLKSSIRNQHIAQGLGWFSVGLGLAEVFAPRTLAKAAGVPRRTNVVRALGVRELVTGIGLITQPKSSAWIWARVAGDVLDLSLLGSTLASRRSRRSNATAITAAVAGVTALDIFCGEWVRRNGNGHSQPLQVSRSLTINCSPEEAYRRWRDFENLPRYMHHLRLVEITGEKLSHWIAKGPGNAKVEWDAELIEDTPGQRIAWRSLPGSDVEHLGAVSFQAAPGGRGTLVKVDLRYSPPAGKLGAGIARLFGQSPEKQIHIDLMRFKQALETGEIATTEGQPAGRAESTSKYDDLVRS